MGEEVRYHKKCPLFGLDIGFGPFKSITYTSDEMNEYCGYDAKYDSTVGKCVPTESFCKSVDVSSIDEYAARDTYCKERACYYVTDNTCDDYFKNCDIDETKNMQNRKGACEANPNCEFDPSSIFECDVKGGKSLFSSSRIRKKCGEGKVKIEELCGDGLTYDYIMKRCDMKY